MSVVKYIPCTTDVLKNLLTTHNLESENLFYMALHTALEETIEDLFVIQLNGNNIGLIDYNFSSSVDPNAIEIQNFEVLEKAKGYGTMIINDFIHQHGLSICLIPLPGSEVFWGKAGFQPYTAPYYRYNMK